MYKSWRTDIHVIRLKEGNWDRPTRRKDYSHIRFSRFLLLLTLCHSFTKCVQQGPNYRRSLSWKQARLGGNASVVEKIVSTWARSLVQNFKSVDPWNDGYIVIVIARLICDSLRILFTSLFFAWSKIEVHFCLFIFHLDLFISVKILTIFYTN